MWQGVCVLCVHCSQFSSSFHTMCFYVWRACYCLHMSIFFGLRSNVHIAHNAFFAHFFIYALRTQLSDFSQLRHLQCKMNYKESVFYGDLSDYMVVFLSGWFFLLTSMEFHLKLWNWWEWMNIILSSLSHFDTSKKFEFLWFNETHLKEKTTIFLLILSFYTYSMLMIINETRNGITTRISHHLCCS